jgi:hypothetical protein
MNPRIFSLLVVGFALLTQACHAQWQTVAYTLRGGWNSVYFHGDMPQGDVSSIFAAHPEVLEVWRWNPTPNQAQFETSPMLPSAGMPEWSRWQRSSPETATLADLTGQAAYLIRCSGTQSNTYTVQLTQKIRPPSATWVLNGATFLGFPTRANTSFPFFSQYFATFPVAIGVNTRIYRYVGGELGPANPIQIFSPSLERVDRNQAYWFDAPVVGNFYGPFEITPSRADGLHFGRAGAELIVRVRNRTASTATITVAPVSSASAPAGQPQITGAVPLIRRVIDATLGNVETPVTGPFEEVIAPQSSVELRFGVNRGQMTGGSNALYASFLRFTDSGNLIDISIPASASVASMAGLWIGDVSVTHVESKAPGSPGQTTGRPFPLRVLLHVDDDGVARLLSQVFLGQLANSPTGEIGLCTREIGLKADAKGSATRFVSTQMPLDTVASSGSGAVALGSTLSRTVTLGFNDRSNPFVHAYHPDHDNRDARLNQLGAGVESYDITRVCSFTFSATPPEGISTLGWGASVIGGTYSETITGAHKESITVSGTFELRRASEIGSITLN